MLIRLLVGLGHILLGIIDLFEHWGASISIEKGVSTSDSPSFYFVIYLLANVLPTIFLIVLFNNTHTDHMDNNMGTDSNKGMDVDGRWHYLLSRQAVRQKMGHRKTGRQKMGYRKTVFSPQKMAHQQIDVNASGNLLYTYSHYSYALRTWLV